MLLGQVLITIKVHGCNYLALTERNSHDRRRRGDCDGNLVQGKHYQ